MRALYSDEEILLRDSISSQVEKLIPTGVADLERFDDAETWRRLAEGDLLGLGVPEEHGGVGTLLDATIVATALRDPWSLPFPTSAARRYPADCSPPPARRQISSPGSSPASSASRSGSTRA